MADAMIDPSRPLTGWMAGAARPVRGGVYERRSAAGRFACWGGRHWYADASTPREASRNAGLSADQAAPWRGVAEPTSPRCATCRGHCVLDRGFDEEADRDSIEECADC